MKNNGLKLAVVTGANKEFATKIVSNYFESYFDVLINGEDVKNSKPSPEPYLKALELLKLSSQEVLVIENAPLGIKSAKNANLEVLALQTTLEKSKLKEADLIFKNHEDLFQYVKQNI